MCLLTDSETGFPDRPLVFQHSMPLAFIYSSFEGWESESILTSINIQGKVNSFFFFQEVTSKRFSKRGQNGGKERAKEKMKKEAERQIKHNVIHCVLTGLELGLPCTCPSGRWGSVSGLSPGKILLYSAKVRCLQSIIAHFPPGS